MALIINFTNPSTGTVSPEAYFKAEIGIGKYTYAGASIKILIWNDAQACEDGFAPIYQSQVSIFKDDPLFEELFSSAVLMQANKTPNITFYDHLLTLEAENDFLEGVDFTQAISTFSDAELAQGILDGLPLKGTGKTFFRESTKEFVQWDSQISDWFSIDN